MFKENKTNIVETQLRLKRKYLINKKDEEYSKMINAFM